MPHITMKQMESVDKDISTLLERAYDLNVPLEIYDGLVDIAAQVIQLIVDNVKGNPIKR